MATTMTYSQPAARASEGARAEFIRRTYTHLAFAILGFLWTIQITEVHHDFVPTVSTNQ